MALTQFYNNVIKKACSRSQMILHGFFVNCGHYSCYYAFWSAMWWIGFYGRLSSLSTVALKKKTKFMHHYLKPYSDAALAAVKVSAPMEQLTTENYYIWVLWWQGMDSAPELVRACYANLVHQNGSRVKLITKDNINLYVDIPKYILEKVENNIITFTHFSDILRVSLLACHGGIWIDSTCWTTEPVPKRFLNCPVYTSKTKGQRDYGLWSNAKWSGWLLGTNSKQHPGFVFCRQFFVEYWKNETVLIDYLLIDFVLTLAYENVRKFQLDVDNVPFNNENRNSLYFLLNQEYDYTKLQKIMNNSWCFKLSYKHNHPKKSKSGKITFYGYILDTISGSFHPR